MSDSQYKKPTTIAQAYSNPRYQGKIVVESPEGLYSTTDDERANEMIQKLQKKYPDRPPVTTVIPKGLMVTLPFEVH